MAPPYDVISPEAQEFFYDQSPFNIIRLILGKEFPNDNDENNRYTRSRDFLNNWLKEGVMEIDDAPSIYGYAQTYRDPAGVTLTRRGFIALLGLEEWGKGGVFPHERTYSGPKSDRLKLVRATGHQMSFIFSIFSDPKGETTPLIEKITASDEVTRYTDEDGVQHVFTRSVDSAVDKGIIAAMSDKKVFIADGHHRYETMLAYRDELSGRGVAGDDHRFAVMYFTPLEGEAVTILPCHRIVALDKPIDNAVVMERLGRYFTIEDFENNPEGNIGFINSLERKGKGSFGFSDGGRLLRLLTIKDDAAIDEYFPAEMRREIRRLDVSILHHLIIDGVFGFIKPVITYSHNVDETLKSVGKGKTVAFLVNPTRVDEVKAASLAGERLPQKSTYFYPKLASGLALYRVAAL
jgi:uncharacterized protein (DUF1015 family)